MTFGSLFAGIGGIDLGLERAGFQCRWQVENDKECIKNLEKHWPGVKRYGDITTLGGNDLEPVDLIAGGFPCQDLSQAGKRVGIEGSRSGLWFEFARLVGELRPRYVLVENVPGLLVYDGMRRVIGELARLGYVGIWLSVRASDVGASHLRKRIFIVAYCEGREQERPSRERSAARSNTGRGSSDLAYSPRGGLGELRQPSGSDGLTDGSHAALADAPERERCSGPHNGQRTPEATGSGSASLVADLADPSTGFLPQPRRRPERGDGTGSAGQILLDNAVFAGLERGDRQREQSEQLWSGEPLTPSLLPFAPGPSDPRWPAILRERPDLAPSLMADSQGRKQRSEPTEGRGSAGRTASNGTSRGIHGESKETPQSPLCRMADGLPDWMDGAMKDRTKRLRRLGNAVVPQVAEYIGRRIMEFSSCQT